MAGHGPEAAFMLRLETVELPETGAVSTGSPTQQLTATLKDAAGREMRQDDFAPAVVWASSDPTKATVSQSGLVTKVAAGTTNVTAKVTRPAHLGGQEIASADCVVTVS